jgi:DNA-binding transcriptional LysR family regulator
MDLKRLTTFRSVAKHGSLGRAATQQGLTIPAVCIQIKTLEKELGVKLFDHHLNKLVLNDRGLVFLKEIGPAFDALEKARAAVTEPVVGYSGAVSVSLATDIARFFAPAIAAFIKEHPKLKVTILARPSREGMAQVVSGEVDIGVGFFKSAPRGVARRKVSETRFCLIFPRGHELASKKRLTLQDIATHRVVMPRRNSPTGRIIDAAFADSGLDLPDFLEVARCQTGMDFVDLGLGVGIVHRICACAETHKNLVQVDMSQQLGKTDIALITRENNAMSLGQQALVRALLDTSPKALRRSGRRLSFLP